MKFLNWLLQNRKEIAFFLLTWGIGWYLFSIVICLIDPNSDIKTEHWTIFYTAIFLLLLPFVSKITLGSILKVERELKETKKEFHEYKDITQNQLQFLTNNINYLSQNLTNNIVINNNVPDTETLESANETLEKVESEGTRQELEGELKLETSNDEWVWISNLLKIRIQIEKELRSILGKRTTVKNQYDLDIKFLSLKKLFDLYISTIPTSKTLGIRIPMRLFHNVANAAIHGQTISRQQYEQAKMLGVNILLYIRITPTTINKN